DLLRERLFAKAKALEDALDAIVEIVGIVMVKLVLNVLEAVLQSLSLGFVALGGNRVCQLFRMPGQVGNIGQRRSRFAPNRAIGDELRMLFQIAKRGRRV